MAHEKKIFQKHGLDVRLKVYDTAQPLMQALVEGKVDVAGYTALPITFNGMLRSDKKLYFLTTMIEDSRPPDQLSFAIEDPGRGNAAAGQRRRSEG